jgi:hypothetical protein
MTPEARAGRRVAERAERVTPERHTIFGMRGMFAFAIVAAGATVGWASVPE